MRLVRRSQADAARATPMTASHWTVVAMGYVRGAGMTHNACVLVFHDV